MRNKVVLVTGMAHGCGRVLAESFAAEGAKVVGCDVDAGWPAYPPRAGFLPRTSSAGRSPDWPRAQPCGGVLLTQDTS